MVDPTIAKMYPHSETIFFICRSVSMFTATIDIFKKSNLPHKRSVKSNFFPQFSNVCYKIWVTLSNPDDYATNLSVTWCDRT